MSKFKEKLKKAGDKIKYSLYGCYGYDDFSKFLTVLSVICIILSVFTFHSLFYYTAVVLYFYIFYRCLSTNKYKRSLENNKYLSVKSKMLSPFRLMKRKFADRKLYRYYKCRKCKTVMRVPKGKGEIEITCPKCETKTIKKT
ncbi:MAG: hypothetical protein IJ306_08000 [Oscillospiraceae bacterium]|nr:hypothetical protein [Oscillospiraceae bacterium]